MFICICKYFMGRNKLWFQKDLWVKGYSNQTCLDLSIRPHLCLSKFTADRVESTFRFFLFSFPPFSWIPQKERKSWFGGVGREGEWGDLTWFMSGWKTEVFCWAVLSVAVADLDCFRSLQDFHFRQSETSMAWSGDGVWKCDEGGGTRERKIAGHKCQTIMNGDGWSHAR